MILFTVKRKRQLTDSSENTELGQDSDGSEFDFSGEVQKKEKRKIQKTRKANRRPPKKPVKRGKSKYVINILIMLLPRSGRRHHVVR